AQKELLRQEILKKNEFFFNRSRPANMAYILGFRKHEQGKNAAEIPMFDPLIEAKEQNIARLLKGETLSVVSDKIPAKMQWVSTDQPLPEFEVASGFEVKLFAKNPQLAKPIHMNFDPRGRLWIVSSEVYPQIEPGQKASDKVLILEDADHDGIAEKSTIFVDGLLIPTGVLPGDGGVYVAQSTELLHFKDTDGDGKADQRRVVLSGFGTEDTHHIIHTPRWGMDGQMYFNQSLYIRADLETPHNVVRLRSGGIFNLRPPTMDLEIFLRGFCNSWGHVFDDFGQSFVTDGCGGQGISFGIRDATYFTYANMRRELKSISPGAYPKFCGLEIVKSQQFPEESQGNLITCDFRAHRVVQFGVQEQGAGFITKELPDLMRTTNVTFRPIDVKMGPDGALYVADWANPIIQHGEVDFRDPRRDHEHGRIWRVTAKGPPLVKIPKLTNAKNEELFQQLLSPNLFNQEQARRVLTERGEKIKSDLSQWTKSQTDEKALLQALWIYQSIDQVEPDLLQKLIGAKDGRIRAAAIRVLSFWQNRVKNPESLLAKAVQDSHPRVRLEAVRALAKNNFAPAVSPAGTKHPVSSGEAESVTTDPKEFRATLVLTALNQP
ncbi:MAG: PVC-type heme-binding CxxCH protein, partial [Limisphaerales bacterium]